MTIASTALPIHNPSRRGLAAWTALQHVLVDGVTRHHAEQGRDRPAQGEACRATDDLAPDLHIRSLRELAYRIKLPIATAASNINARRR